MDDYQILSTIAKTATSKVLLARHIPTQQLYAIKQINVPKPSDDDWGAEEVVVIASDSDDDSNYDDSSSNDEHEQIHSSSQKEPQQQQQQPLSIQVPTVSSNTTPSTSSTSLNSAPEKTNSWKRKQQQQQQHSSPRGSHLGAKIASTPSPRRNNFTQSSNNVTLETAFSVKIETQCASPPSPITRKSKGISTFVEDFVNQHVESDDDQESDDDLDEQDDSNKLIYKTQNLTLSLDATHTMSDNVTGALLKNEKKLSSDNLNVFIPTSTNQTKKQVSPQVQMTMNDMIQKKKKQEMKYIQNEIHALQTIAKGPFKIYDTSTNGNSKVMEWPFGEKPKRISDEEKIETFSKYVCQMKKVIEDPKENKLCIVLEYADGGDLFSIIEYYDTHGSYGRMREEQARYYFKQVVCGVLYMHRCGICHRDLKPENILVTLDEKTKMNSTTTASSSSQTKAFTPSQNHHPVLKITDYGFCGILKKPGASSQTLFDDVVGTESWCAPEVLNRQRYDGRKADIWSLGCILFALLTGCFAFDHDDIHELHRMIEDVKIQFPSFINKETKDFILAMICKDPKQRLTIEEVYDHPWMKKGAYL
ncbi:hypothetical protein C9374_007295 [Naegleria lovaniensis]|uniref:Protein kinase domain-containing protein n=1 Tax=Naegleria lovaniensis TaxID=51637 RepID=A0AA88H016_NAELO|nr:uncharacterized protein C9374_007295 [Naegleria lovaniensis]KAG2393764.1 hypothetical protein C9374_007295 [Naegleria lovaniensis]